MPFVAVNPTTEEEIARYDSFTPHQVDEVLAVAARAFQSWRSLSFAERGAALVRAAELLESEIPVVAELMTSEMGKTFAAAKGEAMKCALTLRYVAEHTEEGLREIPAESSGSRSGVRFEPIGVIFAIMPWNFPLWQVVRMASATLMAGNVVAYKHAGNVPGCAKYLEDLFRRAGVMEGVLSNLFIEHEQVGAVIGDRRVAAVTITGSERAGRAVATLAGQNLKKCVLELGGSDPFIVAASADLERAIPMAVNARIQNNGQACIASKRFIVVRERADEFLDGFVEAMGAVRMGDPMDPATALGPLVSRSQRDLIASQVAGSLGAGAKAWVGGVVPDRRGFFYPATVLTDVPASSAAAREELFGPVAVVYVAEDLTDAIRIGNDTPWGLGGSIWAQDEAEIDEALAGMEVGLAFANAIVASMPELPFGGTKASGFGRELSTLGAREFTNAKSIFVQ